jgi:hypothetical protein
MIERAGAELSIPAGMADADVIHAIAQYLDFEPIEKQAPLECHELLVRDGADRLVGNEDFRSVAGKTMTDHSQCQMLSAKWSRNGKWAMTSAGLVGQMSQARKMWVAATTRQSPTTISHWTLVEPQTRRDGHFATVGCTANWRETRAHPVVACQCRGPGSGYHSSDGHHRGRKVFAACRLLNWQPRRSPALVFVAARNKSRLPRRTRPCISTR